MNHKCIFFPKCCKCVFDACVLTVFLRMLSSQAVFDELSLYLLQAAVFAEAFPSFTGSSSSDSCDLSTVPTLSQLLRGGASQDQG